METEGVRLAQGCSLGGLRHLAASLRSLCVGKALYCRRVDPRLFILSFAVPLWLGYRRRKAGRYDDYASAGATFYGGAVALIVAVGLLNGLIGSSLWHSYWGMVSLFTLWMLLTIAAQYGAAKGVDFWHARSAAILVFPVP